MIIASIFCFIFMILFVVYTAISLIDARYAEKDGHNRTYIHETRVAIKSAITALVFGIGGLFFLIIAGFKI